VDDVGLIDSSNDLRDLANSLDVELSVIDELIEAPEGIVMWVARGVDVSSSNESTVFGASWCDRISASFLIFRLLSSLNVLIFYAQKENM
jgi:hypothetical protein